MVDVRKDRGVFTVMQLFRVYLLAQWVGVSACVIGVPFGPPILGFIGYLPNSIVVIVFLGVGGDFSLWTDTPIAASCNLLRVSPTLVPSLSLR